MENADTEEVTLDIEVEAEPEPAKVEIDQAAEAFARLEGEMALMRRAVQHLAAERADIVIPDYGPTLTEMTKRLGAIAGSIGDIAEHPAMQVTPDGFGRRQGATIKAGSTMRTTSCGKRRRTCGLSLRTPAPVRSNAGSCFRRWVAECSVASCYGRSCPAPSRAPCPKAGNGPSAWLGTCSEIAPSPMPASASFARRTPNFGTTLPRLPNCRA